MEEPFQSAYKRHHSTETALLKVSSDVLNEIDNKKVCVLVLLDLSAAFDTIDHEILLERLEKSFLLSGTVLMWFKSYLENRFTSVKIGNDVSDMLPLKYGVPQGSVLGPVIFTMYTQSLSSIISLYALNYHLYADDTQLYGFTTTDNVHSLIDRIARCINDIRKWMLKNKLKLNEDKTEILFIRSSACNEIDNITYQYKHQWP